MRPKSCSHCVQLLGCFLLKSKNESRFNIKVSIKICYCVHSIGAYTFDMCGALTEIKYNGTVAQWNSINKGNYWHHLVPESKVICTDGKVDM